HFAWSGPPAGTDAVYVAGELVEGRFDSLDAYSSATGQDRNSILVDYDVFTNVPPLDTNEPWTLHDPAAVDFTLRAGSAPIDAGVHIPGLNDGFNGAAPDLGALEHGQPVPHYGPRP